MPVTSRSLRLLALPGLCLVATLTGCATSNPCGGDAQYLQARERPRLEMPEGVSGSERLSGPMVIPPAAPDAAKLDPQPKCLDQPPPYFAQKPAAKAGSAEEAVKVWNAAWANGKVDQVAAFYSPQFEATQGGSTAHIADVKEKVASGQAPDTKLEDIKAKDAGPDRKVVTFVQRFGKTAYLKELTLARDSQGWRIVGERTLQQL